MRIIVYHSAYGCDTGCCGHRIELYEDDTDLCRQSFDFTHLPRGTDPIEYAKRLVTKEFGEAHVKDLDWENCKISDYDGCDN